MPQIVHTIESTERWSEFTLDDGTTLMLKASFGRAVRQDTHDANGFPQYAIENVQLLVLVKKCKDEVCATKQ